MLNRKQRRQEAAMKKENLNSLLQREVYLFKLDMQIHLESLQRRLDNLNTRVFIEYPMNEEPRLKTLKSQIESEISYCKTKIFTIK